MLITGLWLQGKDGVVRPFVAAEVVAAGGNTLFEYFLLDTGSDRTIFSAALLAKLGLPTLPAPTNLSVGGVGGFNPVVLVDTTLELPRADGGVVQIQVQFLAFTQMGAFDVNLLGRDLLDHFDVIVSRPRGEVQLLAGIHHYAVS